MAWNGLSHINGRGALAAALVTLLLIIVETLIDAPLIWNALRFIGRVVRPARAQPLQ
jgi:hypothetical protein